MGTPLHGGKSLSISRKLLTKHRSSLAPFYAIDDDPIGGAFGEIRQMRFTLYSRLANR